MPPTVRKGDTVTLDITTLAFGGRGLARLKGLAVFVDQALPGDRVSARITRKKSSFAEARLLEVLSPSPFRVPPACPYCGFCGGCRLQILDYDRQLACKREQVAEALRHIGLVEEVPVHPVVPADRVWGYRNKMEFSFSDKRWLLPREMETPGADTDFALGLHVPGTFHKVIDIDACLLLPEPGNAILCDVRQYARASGIPAYGLKTHQGFWRFLMLRHSVANDNWMVNIITAAGDKSRVAPLADLLAEKYPQVVSVVNNVTARKAGVALGEYEIPLRGEPCIQDRLGRFVFDISANSFFQTNTCGAERLYAAAKAYAGLTGDQTVVDLYCGTGTISIWLSDAAKEVIGLEINESCLADAARNCRANNVTNVRFVAGDVKDTFSRLERKADVMVIDPPRAGMHKDVVDRVLAMAPPRVVYVSCNPATLARDVSMLKEAYEVAEVQPVDMFPHTPHIECVARLEKK
ncbi:MAG: 23S rRNA (uracil(1939)-C(5))-methyltransferase RlmD [Thermodesulfobacteriota bacterium]